MKRPPRTHADIMEAIERSAERKRPLWQTADEPLELYVSPAIKARFGLKCKTTVEYLAGLAKETDATPNPENH